MRTPRHEAEPAGGQRDEHFPGSPCGMHSFFKVEFHREKAGFRIVKSIDTSTWVHGIESNPGGRTNAKIRRGPAVTFVHILRVFEL